MDAVDITGENDFSEERLRQAMGRKVPATKRGTCLYCTAVITAVVDDLTPLYCDSDCRKDFERESQIRERQTNRRT